jgi:hypothetical protein
MQEENNTVTPSSTSQSNGYNKWHSRRWIATLWAMGMVTAIMILSFIKNTDQWGPLAMTLAAIPVGFTTLETLAKKRTHPHQEGQL